MEGNEMEREKRKSFPKRSHQLKRIMYFKATLGGQTRYIKYPLVKISKDIKV
jgi:hypothetical protein